MDRALVHEAGHAIVALHIGFRVEQIGIFNGFPRLMISNFDEKERTPAERIWCWQVELRVSNFLWEL